jgi:hypothetical protein
MPSIERSVVVALGLVSSLAACGDDRLQPTMNPPVTPPPVTESSGLSGLIFDFSDALVLGVSSGLELRIGTLAGTPEKGPFVIASLGNSDEAAGTFTVAPCLLEVTSSSFPPNARLVRGAMISLECTFDKAAGILRLTDPTSRTASEGELCADGCGPSDGN